MRFFPLAVGALFAVAVHHTAVANTASTAAFDSVEIAWIITATALSLMMTLPGLTLFYAGLVQANNISSVLIHHFALACLPFVLWVAAGY